MQKKNGISLIVLVITIIVMIILAATVVISLSNTGIIDRAGKAVDLTNEASVQDLAALTWADAYMDNLRGQDLIDKVTEELEEQGVTAEKWNITISDTGVVIKSKDSSSSEETLATKYNWTRTGTCGTGVNYGFDETTGTLGIWGSGSIDDYSFDSDTNIKTVIIEEGVTSIGSYAFGECSALEEVTIPASVTSIASHTFYMCTSLSLIKYFGKIDIAFSLSRGINPTIQVPENYTSDTFATIPVEKVLPAV